MKRVLFVDDEPKVLAGLQRMLRPLRHEWRMTFAAGGAEALAMLERGPFDVLVTDMRMPGIDGPQLLEEVRRRFPHVLRIALTGQYHGDAVQRSAALAHYHLAKPCDPDMLKEAIGSEILSEPEA